MAGRFYYKLVSEVKKAMVINKIIMLLFLATLFIATLNIFKLL